MSMRLLEISTTVKLVTEECPVCGILYAMPEEVNKRLRTEGGTFYCPNGHSQYYTKPTIDILRQKLRAEENRADALNCQLNGALDSLAANKKELRQAKKRANAGLCPHCRRHFENLERHIHNKHPEEVKAQ